MKSTRLLIAAVIVCIVAVFSRIELSASDSEKALSDYSVAMSEIPKNIGEWECVEETEIPDNAAKILECSGSIVRTYRHVDTKKAISLALVLGRPGPISVHSPEICYRTRIGDHKSKRSRHEFGEDSFWQLRITPKDAQHTINVLYAWNDGSGWIAPWSSRFAFIGRPLLYKLQVSSVIQPGDTGADLEKFVPMFTEALKTHIYQD